MLKKFFILKIVIIVGMISLFGCDRLDNELTGMDLADQDAKIDRYAEQNGLTFKANKRIGRSMNLGNSLEGPREGAWGLYLKEEYFADIAEAGFNSVRVPIRWSAYAGYEAPYEISDQISNRVDWVIEQAFKNDLAVIINVHHFDAIMQMPDIQIDRLVAIWSQIAEHYQAYPETLYFEVLNEPHEKLDNVIWNRIFPLALAAIRETNPNRFVIVGPDQWNSIDRLDSLELPEDDRRIIVTFHYYKPHEFTHQGASWSSAADIEDRSWGSDEEVQALQDDFARAFAWSDVQRRPLFMGEFGVFGQVPEETRVVWLKSVREEAEKNGFSWAHWDFGTDFAAYNLSAKVWREPILNALIPNE